MIADRHSQGDTATTLGRHTAPCPSDIGSRMCNLEPTD
jgi:hypothetical protein